MSQGFDVSQSLGGDHVNRESTEKKPMITSSKIGSAISSEANGLDKKDKAKVTEIVAE